MYCIFLETKNDDFLKSFAGKICPIVMSKLFSDYDLVKKDDGEIDMECVLKYLKDEGMNLYLINCYLFLGQFCANKECCTDHETVFVSNQVKIFREAIECSYKAASEKQKEKAFSIRNGIYRLYQAYANKAREHMEIIESIYDGKYTRHWKLYIDKVKGYAKKEGMQGSFYIRAETNSDYDKFKTDTELTNLNPCDTIRSELP